MRRHWLAVTERSAGQSERALWRPNAGRSVAVTPAALLCPAFARQHGGRSKVHAKKKAAVPCLRSLARSPAPRTDSAAELPETKKEDLFLGGRPRGGDRRSEEGPVPKPVTFRRIPLHHPGTQHSPRPFLHPVTPAHYITIFTLLYPYPDTSAPIQTRPSTQPASAHASPLALTSD